jgi:hypothetical protein
MSKLSSTDEARLTAYIADGFDESSLNDTYWKIRYEGYKVLGTSTKLREYEFKQLQLYLDTKDYDEYLTKTEQLKSEYGITRPNHDLLLYDLGILVEELGELEYNIPEDQSTTNILNQHDRKCVRCYNKHRTVGNFAVHPDVCCRCIEQLAGIDHGEIFNFRSMTPKQLDYYFKSLV